MPKVNALPVFPGKNLRKLDRVPHRLVPTLQSVDTEKQEESLKTAPRALTKIKPGKRLAKRVHPDISIQVRTLKHALLLQTHALLANILLRVLPNVHHVLQVVTAPLI